MTNVQKYIEIIKILGTPTAKEIAQQFIVENPEVLERKRYKQDGTFQTDEQILIQIAAEISSQVPNKPGIIRDKTIKPFTFAYIDEDVIDDETASDDVYDRQGIISSAELSSVELLKVKWFSDVVKAIKENGLSLHVDHSHTLKEGGEHHPDNLQILDSRANTSKGSKSTQRMTWDQQVRHIELIVESRKVAGMMDDDNAIAIMECVALLKNIY